MDKPRSLLAPQEVAKNLYYGAIRRGLLSSTLPLERTLEAVALRTTLQQARAEVLIDVGANIGQFAGFARRVGFKGWIVSFEPQPAAFAQLRQARRGDRRWVGYQMALGDDDGELSLNIARDSVTSSFLPSINADRYQNSVVVPVRRLDTLWPEVADRIGVSLDARVFLKLDTQGYDLHAFTGARGMLRQITALISELSSVALYEGMPPMHEALRIYDEAGFAAVHFAPVSRDVAGRVLEYDCLLTRRQAVTGHEVDNGAR